MKAINFSIALLLLSITIHEAVAKTAKTSLRQEELAPVPPLEVPDACETLSSLLGCVCILLFDGFSLGQLPSTNPAGNAVNNFCQPFRGDMLGSIGVCLDIGMGSESPDGIMGTVSDIAGDCMPLFPSILFRTVKTELGI